jgi:hypothetical protein
MIWRYRASTDSEAVRANCEQAHCNVAATNHLMVQKTAAAQHARPRHTDATMIACASARLSGARERMAAEAAQGKPRLG